MEIAWRAVGDVTVLDLTGRLTVSPSDTEVAPLRAAIGELTTEGGADVALNLAGLTYLDARGLGELVHALKMVRAAGGQLMLLKPSPRVARLLSVTRLDTVFECCETEDELKQTFGSSVPTFTRRNPHPCLTY